MSKIRDLTGMTFTRLTVISRHPDPRRNPRWNCQCECGVRMVAISGNLLNGRQKSCGCYRGGPTAHRRIERLIHDGYVFVWVPDHPRANPNSGRVREHILVMEESLGRHFLSGEEVHHKNGDRADNRLQNLELWTKSQPSGARVTDKVEWAVELLRLYAPERLNSTTR